MTLRALEPQDLDLLYTIENQQEMWDVCDTNVPYSRFDLDQYLLNQQHDIYADKQLRLVACNDEGKAVGLIDLFNFSPAHQRAELGVAILRSEQGRGYATEALRLLNDYARSVLHLHQLYCIVPEDHAASLAMLRHAGFVPQTTLPDWLLTAEGYKDAVLLMYRV